MKALAIKIQITPFEKMLAGDSMQQHLESQDCFHIIFNCEFPSYHFHAGVYHMSVM